MTSPDIQITDFFKALSDPTRLKIFRILASSPEKKLCVGSIAQKVDVTQPAVSQHLRALKQVGLVTSNRDGFRVHYSINMATVGMFKAAVEGLHQLATEPCDCQETCKKQHD